MKNKPLSLYVHIPFCKYLCHYCDFTKLQYFSSFISPYLDNLEKEIKSYQIDKLETIYIGGGTPSSLEDDELERLLTLLDPYTSNVKEYTLEANPDSLTKSKIAILKKHHINRVSIGVESTSDKLLKAINRHHTFNDVKRVVNDLKEVGINNINVDLILGLPNVTEKMLLEDIKNILSLDVPHISTYSLTVNPHTLFYTNKVKELDDDLARHYYDIVTLELEKAGYIHYEVSNYAKPSYYSLHNLTYWKNDTYYGVGLGASGYIDDIRYTNTKSINNYLRGKYRHEIEKLTKNDEMNYQIMLNLRTIFGLSLIDFKTKYHLDLFELKRNEIDELIKDNFLYLENNTLKATYDGMMVLDYIILKLYL